MSSLGAALGMAPDTRKWKPSPRIAEYDTFVGVEIELENLGHFGVHDHRRCAVMVSGM